MVRSHSPFFYTSPRSNGEYRATRGRTYELFLSAEEKLRGKDMTGALLSEYAKVKLQLNNHRSVLDIEAYGSQNIFLAIWDQRQEEELFAGAWDLAPNTSEGYQRKQQRRVIWLGEKPTMVVLSLNDAFRQLWEPTTANPFRQAITDYRYTGDATVLSRALDGICGDADITLAFSRTTAVPREEIVGR